jgi:hypothetical protein
MDETGTGKAGVLFARLLRSLYCLKAKLELKK